MTIRESSAEAPCTEMVAAMEQHLGRHVPQDWPACAAGTGWWDMVVGRDGCMGQVVDNEGVDTVGKGSMEARTLAVVVAGHVHSDYM